MRLFGHQEEGVKFLLEKKRAILAFEMGMGKTLTAIMAAKHEGLPTLVVVPASLKRNWAREIVLADPEANINILSAGGEINQYNAGDGSEWLIINYDLTSRYMDEIHMLIAYGTIIFDEAHYTKSTTADRSKAALQLAQKAENVYLLSGTPMMNRPIELFNLLRIIRHPLGADWYVYAFRYCSAYWRVTNRVMLDKRTGKPVIDPTTGLPRRVRFLDIKGASNLDELREKMRPVYMRKTKNELAEKLPEKIISHIEVDMDDASRERYDKAFESYLEYVQKMLTLEAVDAQAATEKLDGIMLAKHLVEIQKLKQVASEAKLPTIIKDVLNMVDAGEKVIVFTQYTKTLEKIREAIAKKKIGVVSLSGEDDEGARQKAIDGFQQDESVKVFVGNMKAAGVGITLTAATHVFFADMEWTPAIHSQAEDRAHRIGQKSMVNVYYYIARDTIDEDIKEALELKQEIISQVLEGSGKRVSTDSTLKNVIGRLAQKERVFHR